MSTKKLDNKEFYGSLELAEHIGISDRMIRKYITKGIIKANKIGRYYVISRKSALDFLKYREEHEDKMLVK